MNQEIIEVTVEKLAQGGRGFARHAGKALFLRGGLPGEHVRARIERSHAKFDEAVVVARLSSTHRAAPCPHFDQCGGCDWMRLPEDRQLAEKAGLVRADLERALGSLAHAWRDPVPSPAENYRCRVTLKLADGAVGYYAEGSHDFVPIHDCRIAHAAIRKVIPQLAKDASRFLTAGYAEIELRAGAGDTKPVGIFQGAGVFPALPGYLRGIADAKQASGDCDLRYTAAGHPMLAGPHAFVQVNLHVNDRLVRTAADLLPKASPVIDAYCGNGNFGVALAAKGNTVFGMESNPHALADAERNARQNGVKLLLARAADTQMADVWLRTRLVDDAALLLDPPRAGAKAFLEGMAKRRIAPHAIVYVSCEPSTLLRDVKSLQSRGYTVQALQCFDMFPQTHHVETVVSLRKTA